MSGSISAGTLAAVSAAAAVAGAGIATYGSIQQSEAQSAAARYQAQVAENNAIIQNQNAQYEQQKGAIAVQQSQQKTAAFIGSQLASEASNGLDVNSGSNVDLRKSSSILGEEDALTIRNDAARNSLAYQQAGRNDQSQAALDTSQAGEDELAGFMSGAGSIFGGVGKTSGILYNNGNPVI